MRAKSLRLSLIDAFLCSLMIGAGETYLPAYSLSIGMGEIFAGVLSTLPIFSGAFLQLVTPRGLQKVQSHKHWVVASALLQAFTFIPLTYFSATHAPNFWVLFLVLTLYWGSGFAAGPAWNYWMGRLVQVEEGNKYFAKRARVSQYGILIGLVGGGIALHNKVEIGPVSSVFTLLFLFAAACRLFSTVVLSSQYFDPSWKASERLGFRDSWAVFWNNESKRRFFLRLVPFQAAVFISSPYVAPYLLAQIKMDYGHYMMAIGLMFVGKILALTIIDRFRSTTSGMRLFIFGAAAIAPLPAMWAVSQDLNFIYALQFVSGMSWACCEVGLSLVFFKDLKQEEKVPMTTIYNLLNSLAIIVGTFIGGKILWHFGEHGVSYVFMFVIGGLARLVSVWPIYRLVKSQEMSPALGVAPTPDLTTERAS